MGDTLSPMILRAFGDELEKVGTGFNVRNLAGSFLPSMADVKMLGTRLRHPVQGLKAGWDAMSPGAVLQGAAKTIRRGEEPSEIAMNLFKEIRRGERGGVIKRNLWAGSHHFDRSQGLGDIITSSNPALEGNRMKTFAEELSRRGWTGQSRVTKYLPLGEKGMLTAGTALAVPGIQRAQKMGDEGFGGPAEQTSAAVGGAGAGILSAGLGAPGLVASILGTYGAKRLGRVKDQHDARRAAMRSEGLNG